MITLEKVENNASVCHIERFSKSKIPIYNSEVPDTAVKKIHVIAKCYAFHANTIKERQAFIIKSVRMHFCNKQGMGDAVESFRKFC